MGQSPGAGSPLHFRCTSCRSTLNLWRRPRNPIVVRTGRERPYRAPRGSMLGSRSTTTAREYKCRTCGHTGWSNHMDVKRLPEEW